MSDHATTEQIRTRFAYATRWEYGHRRAESFAADFDRWLAALEAEIRADERKKSFMRLYKMLIDFGVAPTAGIITALRSVARGDGEQK